MGLKEKWKRSRMDNFRHAGETRIEVDTVPTISTAVTFVGRGSELSTCCKAVQAIFLRRRIHTLISDCFVSSLAGTECDDRS